MVWLKKLNYVFYGFQIKNFLLFYNFVIFMEK